MKIYTKTGDKGKTSLATGVRVSKSDARLDVYGTVDELNSFVGWLRSVVNESHNEWRTEVDSQLGWIQNRLFDVGAILAGAQMEVFEESTCRLEGWIDSMQAELPPLRAFILPGGSECVSVCHVCRTVTRRLERGVVELCEKGVMDTASELCCFVNRLSDYWFVLARWIGKNEQIAPVVWEK